MDRGIGVGGMKKYTRVYLLGKTFFGGGGFGTRGGGGGFALENNVRGVCLVVIVH